jgi:hypothetical protein
MLNEILIAFGLEGARRTDTVALQDLERGASSDALEVLDVPYWIKQDS